MTEHKDSMDFIIANNRSFVFFNDISSLFTDINWRREEFLNFKTL